MKDNDNTLDNLDAFRKELSELNEPYTDEELELHGTDREIKSVLEMIHAHNWKLIQLARNWNAYLHGKRPRPVKKISKYVNPGESRDINNACGMIEELVEYMVDYGEGNCPKARIITYCSRSTATLIDRLSKIKHSKHLSKAACASSKLFYFLSYHGEPTMSPEEYQTTLSNITAEFIKACIDNAEELADYTDDAVANIEGEAMGRIYERNSHPITLAEAEILLGKDGEKLDKQNKMVDSIRKAITRIDTRDRKRSRKEKYTESQLRSCQHYWEIGQKNDTIKSNCNSKTTHSAVFEFYKRELTAIGITTSLQFANALKCLGKRTSRKTSRE